mgnify:CR=1 FL=1
MTDKKKHTVSFSADETCVKNIETLRQAHPDVPLSVLIRKAIADYLVKSTIK